MTIIKEQYTTELRAYLEGNTNLDVDIIVEKYGAQFYKRCNIDLQQK